MSKNTGFRASIWQMTLMGMRYLSGRKLRTALTTLAIVFGVAMIFAINWALPSVAELFVGRLSTVSGADVSITSASGASFVPGEVVAQAAGVANVRGATGMLQRTFTLPALGGGDALGDSAQINLIGVDPATIQNVRHITMTEGRFIEVGDVGAAVFPAGLAELAPDLKVGMSFPLITAGGLKIYTVVGFVAEQGALTTPQMYVSLEDAQTAFNQPGLINTVEVSIDPNADKAAVAAAIQTAVGSSFLLDSASGDAGILASMQIGLGVLNLLGMLALFLGAFLIFNTFRTVIIERQRDLGMLRAIGATRRQITMMIMIESLIQGVIGTVIGLILGYVMTKALFGAYEQFAGNYFSGVDLTLNLTLPPVIIASVLGISSALVAGYLPARSAGRTSPLEALRPVSTARVHSAARWSLIFGAGLMVLAVVVLAGGSKGAMGGSLLFLIGMVIAAPGLVIPAARLFSPLLTLWYAREGDLARGNLMRQPGRVAITGSTLMIGLAVLIMMTATVSGLGELVTNLTNASFSSDIVLVPPSIAVYNNVVGSNDSLSTALMSLPEVETVASLRYATTKSNAVSVEVLGIDPVTYTQVASLEFTDGAAETAFPALETGRGVILSPLARTALGVEVGSEIPLATINGVQNYQVVGVATDVLTFKVNAVFISQTNLATDFNKNEDVMIFVNLIPEADKAAALENVQEIVKDYPQFTAHLSGQYRDELVNTTNSAFSVFYGLAILILIPAALGLLNTLTINILERTREIGVVRAVGGSRGQVRRIVTAEALLLGIFSASMGVLAGIAMSYGFIGAFGSIGWDVPYYFPVMGIIAAVILAVVLALFAAILPARSAAKLDIIRALQYE